MLWLPVPPSAGNESAIAVADSSALALEAAMLEQDKSAAVAHLKPAMLRDPWFCKWADAWSAGEQPSIDALAAETAATSLQRFVQAQCGTPAATWSRPGDEQTQQFAKQAATVLGEAAKVLRDPEEQAASQNFFKAMLRVGQSCEVSDGAQPLRDYVVCYAGIEWRLPRLTARLSAAWQQEQHALARLEQMKLDAMKELSYGASHEINNPLANISGRAQALLRDERDPKRRRLLHAIDSQALRAHEMISDLMLFARPPALARELTDIGGLIQTSVTELSEAATDRQITIDFYPPQASVVYSVDSTQFVVAIQALLHNALDAIGNDGRVSIQLSTADGEVEIRVADTGPGFNEEVREHMFEPFYSGREAGRGLGFGLSKCWRIITQHGGTVDAEPSASEGVAFTIRLPATSENTSTGSEGQ